MTRAVGEVSITAHMWISSTSLGLQCPTAACGSSVLYLKIHRDPQICKPRPIRDKWTFTFFFVRMSIALFDKIISFSLNMSLAKGQMCRKLRLIFWPNYLLAHLITLQIAWCFILIAFKCLCFIQNDSLASHYIFSLFWYSTAKCFILKAWFIITHNIALLHNVFWSALWKYL